MISAFSQCTELLSFVRVMAAWGVCVCVCGHIRVDGWMDGSSSPVCTRRLSITAHIHTHTFSVCLSRSVSLSLLACPTHDMLTLPLDVSLHTTPHTGAQDTSQTDRRTEGATRKQNKQPSAFIHNECTHPIPTICDALCD
mmetsp:Transcript_6512/g.15753  ORF Transcript_6512/g.15753 Transcript_6512/m.15753 type:complete len:140 (-) Transcript_6512:263-682(-)